MTQTELNYATVLYELPVEKTSILTARECFKNVPTLKDILANPTIDSKKKGAIIEKVFPKDIQAFLKKICEYGRMGQIEQIFEAYDKYCEGKEAMICAQLFYVTKPSKEQQEGFEQFIKKEYGCREVKLQLIEERSLLGGFLLKVGSIEYDYSLMGKLKTLRQQIIG